LHPPRRELAALLAGAKEQPDDETPLLVLADWLEEQSAEEDRAHGELVRIEAKLRRAEREDRRTHAAWAVCQLYPSLVLSWNLYSQASKALHAGRPELAELPVRAAKLRDSYGHRWAGTLAAGRTVYWPRGLMGLNCPPRAFQTGLTNTVAAAELGCWLSELRLRHSRAKDLKRIAGCSLLAQLAKLSLDHQSVEPAGASSLASSPHLSRLVTLDLSGARIGDEGVVALGAARLDGLRELHLTHTHFKQRGGAALNGSAWFGRLGTLNLWVNGLDAAAIEALFAGQTMPQLQWLNLGNNKLGAEGVAALLTPGRFPSLRGLSLSNNDIGPEGLRRLLAWPGLSGLTTLALGGCKLGDAEAEALADCAALANLTSLSLGGNAIGDNGFLALARSPHLRGLFGLDVNSNRIAAAGGEALADARHFPGLGWLNGWGNPYGESATLGIRKRFPEHGSA
jgi:uncharacterized protein (TIGR02996 family)